MGLEFGRMRDILQVLLAIALLAVAVTLAVGIYSLFRGGEFGRTWSNKLMRLRVVLQFVAILVLVAAVLAQPEPPLSAAMVTLNQIYTRTGDGGTTRLATGEPVLQDRSAGRGLRRGRRDQRANRPGADCTLRRRGARSDPGAHPERPVRPRRGPGHARPPPTRRSAALRILDSQVARLEAEIDALNGELGRLTSFVLPGGSPAAAALHLARTVCRRAERACGRAWPTPRRERQPGGAEVPQPALGPAVRRRPLRQRQGRGRRALAPGATR